MSVLYAGPWIGEFGWELCWWNPIVRYHAERYDRVIVASHERSGHLYEFADEFIPLKTDGGYSFRRGTLCGPMPQVKADCHLSPDNFGQGESGRAWRSFAPQETAETVDVLCAFRPPKQARPGESTRWKHYPRESCGRVAELLLSRGFAVGCYGLESNYWFDGTADLRGMPLDELCAALAGARCAVGPSSGTIHLASLCGCPHVTWFGTKHGELARRYEKDWNPFSTPVAFLPQKPPEPETIVEAVESMTRIQPS